MSFLLMNIHVSHGSFLLSLNFKFFLVSCLLHLLYKICSIIKSSFCILIVGVNMQVMNLIPSVSQMALHMNTLALTLLNKMDSLRESIVTLLTLLSQFSLPLSFWPYAFNIAVFLINRLPYSIPNRNSPWELLFKTCSSYESLRTFGYLCYPLLRPYNSHKLQPRSVECVFLGYPTNAKDYLCYDPKSQKYYTSRHVLFTESIFPFTQQSSTTPYTPPSLTWLNTNLYFHSYPLSSIIGSSPSVTFPPLPSILGLFPSAQPTSAPPTNSPLSSDSIIPSPSLSSQSFSPTPAKSHTSN
jgi:hypothetical protein